MLFTEEPNYFPGAEGPWKAPGMGPGSAPNMSKLNTWAARVRGNPSNNGTDDDKSGWSDKNTPEPKVAWSDPLQESNAGSLVGSLENEFIQMNNNGTPKNGAQWGRSEVNQTTPWDLDPNARPPPVELAVGDPAAQRFVPFMDNGTGHWRAWEQGGGIFSKEIVHEGPFPPMGNFPGSGKMHGNFYGGNNFVMQPGFNDRMMRNGPPNLGQQQQQQPWMNNKYSGMPGGGGGRGFQNFPGPPQGPHMMPPMDHHRSFMPPPHHQMPGGHHGGPHHPSQHGPPGMAGPPPMPLAPHLVHGQPGANNFGMGNFPQPNMVNSMVNDDAVWHDPNGDLRKWQRDTGTAAWGDPAKQSGQQIKRWRNPDVTESLSSAKISAGANQSPDSLKKDDEEIQETGWGELPPIAPPSSSAPIPQQHQAGGGGTGGWMGPGPAAAAPQMQPHNAGVLPVGSQMSGWADSQRPMNPSFNPPGAQFGQNNFYGGAAPGPVGDWPRPSSGIAFNSPLMGGNPAAFDGGAPNGMGGGGTSEVAEKLRLAASKGLIDANQFLNMGRLPPETITHLNNLLATLSKLEQNDALIDRLKRMDGGQMKAVGGGRGETSPIAMAIQESNRLKSELKEQSEKVNQSIDGQSVAPQRSNFPSLADEISNMSLMPAIGGDVVGQLW